MIHEHDTSDALTERPTEATTADDDNCDDDTQHVGDDGGATATMTVMATMEPSAMVGIMATETTTVMVTAAGYDCIDMRAVSNGEAATNKSTEDARIFTAEPHKAVGQVH